MELAPGIKRSVVLGVDVGTTNIKCYAYDRFSNVVGKAEEKISLLSLGEGKLEISPDDLWENFKKVINNCLISSSLVSSEVSCMGISTQRGTFITWDKKTGVPFHNFISWKDTRAKAISEQLNSSLLVKLLQFGAFLLYILTQFTKFQIYSTVKFSSAMVLMRLVWILQNYPEIRQMSCKNRVLFGTIDTWLLWKLTEGNVHATDGSNACVTGFFDPFKMEWTDWTLKFFNIPKNILPTVKSTSDFFGETDPCLFGTSIPICCLVGDQQASLFGAGCFQKNSINCTMGTGSFLNINTGNAPPPAAAGIFPLVGWTLQSKTTYVAECGMYDAGTTIAWLQDLGFISDPSESSRMAQSARDTGGVYFFPAQNPLKVSEKRHSLFIGMSVFTTKEQMVRSVLESLAFQVGLLLEAISKLQKRKIRIQSFRIDGGVAKNDFIVQTISNTTSLHVQRLKNGETSSLGAAFLAGLEYGIWKTEDELTEILGNSDVFSPDVSQQTNLDSYKTWKSILKLGLIENYLHQPTDL